MAKNKRSVREFIEILGELYGPPPGGTGGPADYGVDELADPELEANASHINYNRLARVFAHDPTEASHVALGLRRFLTDQHLTLEMKDVLLAQFRKVLLAAESDHSVLLRLERMIMPHHHGGGSGSMTVESVGGAAGSAAARLGRMLLPHSAELAKQAIHGLQSGERMPSAKIKVLLSLLGVLIEVFEQNPELLNSLQSKVRGVATHEPTVAPAGGPPAVGQPVTGQPLMGAAGQTAA